MAIRAGLEHGPVRRAVNRRRNILFFAAGAAVAVWLLRRRIAWLLTGLKPYLRRSSPVESPALIINRWSGGGKAETFNLAEQAEALGIRTIMLEPGDDLAQLAHDAIDRGADAVGMAGGDGSLGLVAGVAIARGVPFFCVPVGTRNHFALDLGLDRDDPVAALEAVSNGDELQIDYGMVGDRVFLNNVSIGVYATAVHREAYRGEKARTIAEVLIEAANDPTTVEGLKYEDAEGVRRSGRIPLLLISNNAYTLSGPPDHGRRTRLDDGVLGVAVSNAVPDQDALEGDTVEQLSGWRTWTTKRLTIEAEGDELLTGVDGEALAFDSPVEIVTYERGLRVLVPSGTLPGYLPPGSAVAARLLDVAEIGFDPASPAENPVNG